MKLFKKRTLTPKESLLQHKQIENKSSGGGALALYLRLLTDKISKGRSARNLPTAVLGNKQLGTGQYFYSSNRIFTKKGVKKMYFVTSLPIEMDWGWVDDLRDRITMEMENYNGNNGTNYKAQVNLVLDGNYFDFDYTNRRIQGRWKQLNRMYNRVQNNAENRTLEDELKNNKWDDQVRHKVNSFLYMKKRKEEGASFFTTTIALEICVEVEQARGEASLHLADDALYLAENTLNEYLFETQTIAKPVFLQANEYQRAYTPASSIDRKSLLKDMNQGTLVTDEILASFTVVEHGKVGDDVGILHGIDIQSNEDVVFNLGKDSDGNNILVTAAVGQGKSGYMKMIYTFVAYDPKYQTVIFDYEGTEYSHLGTLFDAVTVGFDGRSGSYINTLVADDPVGDPEIDNYRLDECKEATMRIFNILFRHNGEFGMSDSEVHIFNEVLTQAYANVGVDVNNQSTWHRTKKLTFAYYFAVLTDMINSNKGSTTLDLEGLASDRADGNGMGALHNFKLVLQNYFSSSGAKSSWFKNPVSIGEVVRAKNVILSFNMGRDGESAISNDSQQLALNQLFAGELTLKKARYNKSRGVFTINIIEELQRYLKLDYSIELVSKLVTGGRKLNIINYLVTNSPTEMIDDALRGDKKSNGVAGILNNINMQIIGASDRNVMFALINYFNLTNATSYLEQLADIKDSDTDNSPYKYTFFLHKGNQSTLVKQLIHPELAKLPLYKTVESFADGDEKKEQLRSAISMDKEEVDKRINESYAEDISTDKYDRLKKNVKDNVLVRGEKPIKKGLFGGD